MMINSPRLGPPRVARGVGGSPGVHPSLRQFSEGPWGPLYGVEQSWGGIVLARVVPWVKEAFLTGSFSAPDVRFL